MWLRSSLMQYYDRIDDLVVLVPRSHRGWRGTPIPVAECLAIVKAVDVRGISRLIEGEWCDPEDPLRADTAQRLDGVRALRDTVDWILQIDNDEVLMDPAALIAFVEEADRAGEVQVDWPLRTLFRQVAPATYLEVCSLTGRDRRRAWRQWRCWPGMTSSRSGVRSVQYCEWSSKETTGPC